MARFTDDLSLEDFEDELSDMLRLDSREIELRYDVWLDYQGKERKRKNNSPRLMIDLSKHLDMVPISIDEFNPEILIDREVPEFDKVSDWIKENYQVLIRHWNQEIDDMDAASFLVDGVTFHEWQRQHYLLLTQYWNGDISDDEFTQIIRKEEEELKNARKKK